MYSFSIFRFILSNKRFPFIYHHLNCGFAWNTPLYRNDSRPSEHQTPHRMDIKQEHTRSNVASQMVMVTHSQWMLWLEFQSKKNRNQIFLNWISTPLVDLHAMNQTCKRLRQVAGYFFWPTYKNADVKCKNGGIFIDNTQINGFCEFVRSISIVDDDLQCFHFIKSNEFKSLKQITLRRIRLTTEKIACIKHILNKIEAVTLLSCAVGREFYGEFLRYCVKVKHIMF